MKNRSEIIVIGAGACGLMAAKELSGKGRQVTILEARDRIGGRIHTFSQHGFLQPVETGAEFIHGNLPVTLKLLKEAKIPYTKAEGEMLRNTDGHWQETDELTDDWDELMKQMAKLKEDMTLTQFLNTHFSDEAYRDVKEQALQYAQGFDAVDPDKASVFALRNEWSHEEQATYRIEGGYQRLMDALVASCIEQNCFILLNKAVTGISWQKGEAIVTTVIGETFCAKQVIITIPAGVLQAGESEKGHIGFTPSLPQMQAAISNIGYGNVVKILLQFSACFWQEQKDALFFFSDQEITTWWTQQPASYPLLTGWIAGKKTSVFDKVSDDELLDKAVQSVAGIFNKSREEIRQTLTAYHIVNWKKDGYAKGAYSYSMIGSEDAKKVMSEPVENTLFFAGEALYSGMSGGTVEAALVQGLEVAKKVLKNQS